MSKQLKYPWRPRQTRAQMVEALDRLNETASMPLDEYILWRGVLEGEKSMKPKGWPTITGFIPVVTPGAQRSWPHVSVAVISRSKSWDPPFHGIRRGSGTQSYGMYVYSAGNFIREPDSIDVVRPDEMTVHRWTAPRFTLEATVSIGPSNKWTSTTASTQIVLRRDGVEIFKEDYVCGMLCPLAPAAQAVNGAMTKLLNKADLYKRSKTGTWGYDKGQQYEAEANEIFNLIGPL